MLMQVTSNIIQVLHSQDCNHYLMEPRRKLPLHSQLTHHIQKQLIQLLWVVFVLSNTNLVVAAQKLTAVQLSQLLFMETQPLPVKVLYSNNYKCNHLQTIMSAVQFTSLLITKLVSQLHQTKVDLVSMHLMLQSVLTRQYSMLMLTVWKMYREHLSSQLNSVKSS